MHSATTATGRPLPPPGKTLPKNRPAPLTSRAPRHAAAAKPDATSELQCYIPVLSDNDRRSPRKINRQPRRLESCVSHTKQTSAPQINRQQMRTLHPAFFAGLVTPPITNDYSPITTHSLSNRHTSRLENAISHRKQTLGTRPNRHFLQVSAIHNHQAAATNRPLKAASKIVSNRQWQILEINVNLSKQTIAPRSNRHKNAVIKCEKSHITTARRRLRWLLPLFLIPNWYITTFGGCTIMLARTNVRKILLVSLVSILLCGMVASELPELLTLTNDTSNDFTVRNTSTAGLRALPDSHRPVRIVAVNSSVPAAILLHSRRSAIETAAPVPSELFILHSVLRT